MTSLETQRKRAAEPYRNRLLRGGFIAAAIVVELAWLAALVYFVIALL